LDPQKILLFAQIGIQIFLIILVVVIIFRDKKKVAPVHTMDELKSLLEETQRLNDEFSRLIQQKSGIITRLIEELDLKMHEAEAVKSGLDDIIGKARMVKTYTKADVLRLSKGGLDPLEISQITEIPVGEIQLMIKLTTQEGS
jgi:cell division protein FtsL